MMGNHFSIILLPTNKCNVDCEYCFEDKTDDRLSLDRLSLLIEKVMDYMESVDIAALTIHWQGGEIMTLPPRYFASAHELISKAAAHRNKWVDHGLQSNLIGYNSSWNKIIAEMFGNSVGTSMDYPNLHRKLFTGGSEEYTRIWERNVRAARAAGINAGVIAVPNAGTIALGAEKFYSYFVDELGITDFQVNTPFPGGDQNEVKAGLTLLDLEELGQFFVDLTNVWRERGYAKNVKLGPMDELVRKFTDGGGCLPCIWQSNCADEFISIDARGYVAQCDCWVTSYPEYFFGNIFQSASLGDLLKNSPARQKFIDRPATIIPRDCIECEYLSICHGGCPVRTYTFRGTMFEKDPYCELYKIMFRHAKDVAATLATTRTLPILSTATATRGCGSCASHLEW